MSKEQAACCSGPAFQIDAVVTVDERGQMVLPKDIRQRAGIQPGEKLALVTWEKDGEVCCMSLIRAGAFSGMVRDFITPLMAGAGQTEEGVRA